eukprot:1061648-Amorphochlora_amoeboformis.AAC.2
MLAADRVDRQDMASCNGANEWSLSASGLGLEVSSVVEKGHGIGGGVGVGIGCGLDVKGKPKCWTVRTS